MPFDRFLIAPINTGLQTDLKPWLIPDDAFQQLNNAYVFRGRVRKRFGSTYTGVGWPNTLIEPLFSRLSYNLGTSYSGTVPGNKFSQLGQQFLVNGIILTVYQNGAMLSTNAAQATGTYNTGTGAYAISGAGVTGNLIWYPSQPVMGLSQLEFVALNDEPSIAFDTQFAYTYNGTWNYSTGSGPWHGSDINLFWTADWQGTSVNQNTIFVSNFFVVNPNGLVNANDDPIWYAQLSNPPSSSPTLTWTKATGSNAFFFAPGGGAPQTGPFVVTARIIVAFKNRLVLLNTIESDGTNNTWTPFRCRFSAYDSVLEQNSWYIANQEDNSGGNDSVSIGAGFVDAPTTEEIVSAEFIKDRLIVYFENSTWELVYTGNQVYPFLWQKINTELGSDATFSIVPFDRQVIAIGTVGVHACNGSNTQRIDEKIPDEIFSLNKKEGEIVRVVGVRDYKAEMVYWTFPNGDATKYPNKVLVYNYRNGSWAFNDDSITFFGYFEQQTDTTWAQATNTWEEANWTWNSGVIEANFRQVIAGNQHGFVYIVDADTSSNAQTLVIANVTAAYPSITLEIIDHTLSVDDYISLGNMGNVVITDRFGNVKTIAAVTDVVDANHVTIGDINYPLTMTGSYVGGGVAGRVSNLGILSKRWNPYIDKDRNVYIQRIDFGVTKTTAGQVTVDYFPSGTELSMLSEGNNTGTGTHANMGTGVLETSPYDPTIYPLEQVQQLLWHPVYFQSDGQTIQIFISMTPQQITNPAIAYSDFVLEGMVLYTQPTTARLN